VVTVETVQQVEDANKVGERLGLKPETVLQMARRGRIPCVRLGRSVVRFDWPDVMRALKAAKPEE
jgi:excisionase family DNA binding protein